MNAESFSDQTRMPEGGHADGAINANDQSCSWFLRWGTLAGVLSWDDDQFVEMLLNFQLSTVDQIECFNQWVLLRPSKTKEFSFCRASELSCNSSVTCYPWCFARPGCLLVVTMMRWLTLQHYTILRCGRNKNADSWCCFATHLVFHRESTLTGVFRLCFGLVMLEIRM